MGGKIVTRAATMTRFRLQQQQLLLWFVVVATAIAASASASVPDRNRQYLLVGVSGGLQDGFPERSKMDYHSGLDDEVKAIYVGKALVRGYKAFLDVMQPGHRQYVEEPGNALINSNVFASGCAEHANEYWVYLVDSRQVMAVLNNEPRFLSITPDTGKVDLVAEETTAAVKDLFLHLAEEQGKSDREAVALPLVTAVWFQFDSHVPSPAIKVKEDGTRVTNFPDSLALWAGLDDADRTAVSGCAAGDETCPAGAHALKYWEGVSAAIRRAEANRPTEEESRAYGPPFKCKNKVKFGVGKDTARINYPFTVAETEAAFRKIGYELDFVKGEMKAMTAVDA